jgi:hypothetical protein
VQPALLPLQHLNERQHILERDVTLYIMRRGEHIPTGAPHIEQMTRRLPDVVH